MDLQQYHSYKIVNAKTNCQQHDSQELKCNITENIKTTSDYGK